jgi:FkbM family methyltransferase
MAPNVENLKWVYDHLVDNESKQLLIQILAYRALGYRRVKLPLNNTNYWNYYQQADDLISGAESVDIGFNGWRAYRLRLDKFGYPMEVFMRPGGVMTQMILQQYRCKSDEHIIEASEGDVVIDGGGCFGDTALYFAHKVGDKGRVYSFEFLPVNLMIFNRNLQLNPSHAKRIKVIPHPLWSKSGESLFVEANGPATRIKAFSNNPQAMQVETLSIDDLVKIERINRLDFIKMDIEGAELAALKGAEQSIKRFRPKLAISVYHNLQDFWEIPQWIQGLSLGYRFHLRHFTIHQEETVIYADVAR